MRDFSVTLKLYRLAISLSDADSHFFPKEKNSCSRNLLNGYTSVQEYIYIYVFLYIYAQILGYQRKKVEGNVWKIGLKLISNRVFAFA